MAIMTLYNFILYILKRDFILYNFIYKTFDILLILYNYITNKVYRELSLNYPYKFRYSLAVL